MYFKYYVTVGESRSNSRPYAVGGRFLRFLTKSGGECIILTIPKHTTSRETNGEIFAGALESSIFTYIQPSMVFLYSSLGYINDWEEHS